MTTLVLGSMAAFLLLVLLLGIGVGSVSVSAAEILAILGSTLGLSGTAVAPFKVAIVSEIRLPRVLLAGVVGAALAVSGAALQGLFRNPLADPGLLGVSASAALGAALFIVLGSGLAGLSGGGLMALYGLPLAAFAGSLAAIWLLFLLASRRGEVNVSLMLLLGVALNAVAAAGVGLMTYLADAEALRTLTFWTLGSLGGNGWLELMLVAPLLGLAGVQLLRCARPLNLLLLGDAEAGHLGVAVARQQRRIVFWSALAVGAAVAVSGMIAFLGLVVPHLVRLMAGPDHRLLLPASALLGAALLITADLFARLALAPAELPIGIVTALVGGPFMFWLLLREARRGRL